MGAPPRAPDKDRSARPDASWTRRCASLRADDDERRIRGAGPRVPSQATRMFVATDIDRWRARSRSTIPSEGCSAPEATAARAHQEKHIRRTRRDSYPMAPDLLETVCTELDARLDELRPFVFEYERLLEVTETYERSMTSETTRTRRGALTRRGGRPAARSAARTARAGERQPAALGNCR